MRHQWKPPTRGTSAGCKDQRKSGAQSRLVYIECSLNGSTSRPTARRTKNSMQVAELLANPSPVSRLPMPCSFTISSEACEPRWNSVRSQTDLLLMPFRPHSAQRLRVASVRLTEVLPVLPRSRHTPQHIPSTRAWRLRCLSHHGDKTPGGTHPRVSRGQEARTLTPAIQESTCKQDRAAVARHGVLHFNRT